MSQTNLQVKFAGSDYTLMHILKGADDSSLHLLRHLQLRQIFHKPLRYTLEIVQNIVRTKMQLQTSLQRF